MDRDREMNRERKKKENSRTLAKLQACRGKEALTLSTGNKGEPILIQTITYVTGSNSLVSTSTGSDQQEWRG